MGKGDKKTKRGKIIKGSYGVRRPKRKTSAAPIPVKVKKKIVEKVAEVVEEKAVVKKAPVKKVAAKKVEDKPIVEKETKVKAKAAPKKAAPKKAAPKKEEKPKEK